MKGRRFRIGEVLLEGAGDCDPCSRMEDALGRAATTTDARHGGLCARILKAARCLGDAVEDGMIGNASSRTASRAVRTRPR